MVFPPGEYRAFVRSEERGQPVPGTDIVLGHFQQFGEVIDVYKPPSTLDICYVTFANYDELQNALLEPAQAVGEVACSVQQAAPRGAGGPPPQVVSQSFTNSGFASSSTTPEYRVYVTGMVDSVDEEILKTYFSYFGDVTDVYIPLDRFTGRKKPFAFVTMSMFEEKEAILAMPRHHLGEGVMVQVSSAEPRWAAPGATPTYATTNYRATASSFAYSAQPDLDEHLTDTSSTTKGVGTQGSADDTGHAVADVALARQAASEHQQQQAAWFNEEAEFSTAGGDTAGGDTDALVTDDVERGLPAADTERVCSSGIVSGPTGTYAVDHADQVGQLHMEWSTDATSASHSTSWCQDKPMQGVPGPNRIFVFGMPEGLNADMLRGHFARHGEILDVYVPQRTPDIAFITFSTDDEVQDALVNSPMRIAGFWVKGIKTAEARDRSSKGKAKGGSDRFKPY